MTTDRIDDLQGAVILHARTHAIMVRLPDGQECFVLWDHSEERKGFYLESTEEDDR